MPVRFSVSPDFNADQLAPWFLFNNWLQHALGEQVHLELYDDFAALAAAVTADQVDLVYANCFDTATLVRERGFVPVASPKSRPDEAIVAVVASSPVVKVTDFPSRLRVSATDAPDVEMIGRILLEPAGLDRGSIEICRQATYVLVAKELLNGTSAAGFFLKTAFEELSQLVSSQLRAVVASRIYVVQHGMLLSPRLADYRPRLLSALIRMASDERSAGLLAELGLAAGWTEMTSEDTEFNIDLMHTLVT